MPDPIERRVQIENAWRGRLERAEAAWVAARDEYNAAEAEYNRVLGERGEAPSTESRMALEASASKEQITRAEYLRLLRIFIDLVVHRIMPEEEAG